MVNTRGGRWLTHKVVAKSRDSKGSRTGNGLGTIWWRNKTNNNIRTEFKKFGANSAIIVLVKF